MKSIGIMAMSGEGGSMYTPAPTIDYNTYSTTKELINTVNYYPIVDLASQPLYMQHICIPIVEGFQHDKENEVD